MWGPLPPSNNVHWASNPNVQFQKQGKYIENRWQCIAVKKESRSRHEFSLHYNFLCFHLQVTFTLMSTLRFASKFNIALIVI